jgi:hypothetical protein
MHQMSNHILPRLINEALEVSPGALDGYGGVWFRGHSDTIYSLRPRMLRQLVARDQEMSIYVHFINRGITMHGAPSDINDGAKWFSVMQHHGLPTRLLDWSSSLLSSIYFASLEKDDIDGCVHILDAVEWNRHEISEPIIATQVHPAVRAIIHKAMYGEPQLEKIVAVALPASHDRVARQRGIFTIHGSQADIREGPKSSLKTISIAGVEKPKIRRELLAIGISRTSFFFDLDGLAQELREMSGLS